MPAAQFRLHTTCGRNSSAAAARCCGCCGCGCCGCGCCGCCGCGCGCCGCGCCGCGCCGGYSAFKSQLEHLVHPTFTPVPVPTPPPLPKMSKTLVPAALVLLVIAVFFVSNNQIATVIVALGAGAYFYLSLVSTRQPPVVKFSPSPSPWAGGAKKRKKTWQNWRDEADERMREVERKSALQQQQLQQQQQTSVPCLIHQSRLNLTVRNKLKGTIEPGCVLVSPTATPALTHAHTRA